MYSTLSLILLAALATGEPDGYGSHPHRHQFGGGAGGVGGGAFGIGQPVVPILVDNRQEPDASGSYAFVYETGDGISRQEQGFPQGVTGAVAQQGGWSFTLPDGTPAAFNFVADENGFRVESDLIPTPPPLPAHAIEQIEKARLEDAAAAASGNRDFFASPSSTNSQFSQPSSQYGVPSASPSQFSRPSRPFGASSSASQFSRPSRPFGGTFSASQFSRPSRPFGAASSASQFSRPSRPFGGASSASQFSRPSSPFGSASSGSQFSRPSRPSTQYGVPSASASPFGAASALAPQFSRPSRPSTQHGLPSASSQFSGLSNPFGAASAQFPQFSRPSTQYGPPSRQFQG
ncbi:pupal cuticle protein 36-like [Macrobrachium rosenbergii]|uniref:pupal cuticle protein 36-like n=1 Tax=Macrobrachium rosenbergii TaxID=79674 RepID=UPI0034D69A6B